VRRPAEGGRSVGKTAPAGSVHRNTGDDRPRDAGRRWAPHPGTLPASHWV